MQIVLTEHKIKTMLLCGYMTNDFNLKYNRESLDVSQSPISLIDLVFANRKLELNSWVLDRGLRDLGRSVIQWEIEDIKEDFQRIDYLNFAKKILNKLKITPDDIMCIKIIVNSSEPDIIIETKENATFFITLAFDCDNNFFNIGGFLQEYNEFLASKIDEHDSFFDNLLHQWITINFNHLRPTYKRVIRNVLKDSEIYDFSKIKKGNYYEISSKSFLGVELPELIHINQFKLHKILFLFFYRGKDPYYFEYKTARKKWESLKKKYLHDKLIDWTQEFFNKRSAIENMRLQSEYYYATPCFVFKGSKINMGVKPKTNALKCEIKNDKFYINYKMSFLDKNITICFDFSIKKLIVMYKNVEDFNIKMTVY